MNFGYSELKSLPTLAIKVGGSLVSPDINNLLDHNFLRQFEQVVRDLLAKGSRVVITTGGGKLNRYYNQTLSDTTDESQHRVGMAVINLHAEILHALFADVAIDTIIRYTGFDDLEDGSIPEIQPGQILICAASSGGHSGDWNLVKLSSIYSADYTIILKDQSGLFTQDPDLDPQARLITDISWDEYIQTFCPQEIHAPGASYPVDPVAARLAQDLQVDLLLLGPDLDNLRSAILKGEFLGTRIRG